MSLTHDSGSVLVRPAALEDVDEIARCHTRSIRNAYRGFLLPSDLAIFTEAETAVRVATQIKGPDTVLVAMLGGRVVGHARWGEVEADYWPYQALVHALFIDTERQRCGAGSALLHACAEGAESGGHKGMMIGAFVDNLPAHVWYERLGGRIIETVPLALGTGSYMSAFFAFDDLPALRGRLKTFPPRENHHE